MKIGYCVLFCCLSIIGKGEDVPTARHIVVPNYPRLARIAQWQGSVRLEITIDRQGKISSVTTVGAHKVLQEAARANIQQWTFAVPSKIANFPIKRTITYTYRLKGKQEYYDLAPSVTLDLPERIEIESRPYAPQP